MYIHKISARLGSGSGELRQLEWLASRAEGRIFVDVPQTQKTEKGPDFHCPHCGALYEVIIAHHLALDMGNASCAVCKKVMNEWNSTSVPSYKLKKRPETDAD